MRLCLELKRQGSFLHIKCRLSSREYFYLVEVSVQNHLDAQKLKRKSYGFVNISFLFVPSFINQTAVHIRAEGGPTTGDFSDFMKLESRAEHRLQISGYDFITMKRLLGEAEAQNNICDILWSISKNWSVHAKSHFLEQIVVYMLAFGRFKRLDSSSFKRCIADFKRAQRAPICRILSAVEETKNVLNKDKMGSCEQCIWRKTGTSPRLSKPEEGLTINERYVLEEGKKKRLDCFGALMLEVKRAQKKENLSQWSCSIFKKETVARFSEFSREKKIGTWRCPRGSNESHLYIT